VFEHLFCLYFSLKYNFKKVYRKYILVRINNKACRVYIYIRQALFRDKILLFKQFKFIYLEGTHKCAYNAPPVIGEWLRISYRVIKQPIVTGVSLPY
jgi:hypothetical protein